MIKRAAYCICVGAALLCFATCAKAQSIGRFVYPSQGGQYSGAGVDLSYTLGETFTPTYTSGSNILSQGFQQPPPGVPLPVTLLYVEAEAINNTYIQVRWATSLEINNLGFDVERSLNGTDFTKIGFVYGHNNSTVENTYRFNDTHAQPGVVYYYRLKQIDNNGSYKYTDVVSARLNAGGSMNVADIFPNPAATTAWLKISSSADQQISLDIYNVIGQNVFSNTYQIVKGSAEANKIELNLQQFAAGTYTAVVTTANELYTQKLVITR